MTIQESLRTNGANGHVSSYRANSTNGTNGTNGYDISHDVHEDSEIHGTQGYIPLNDTVHSGDVNGQVNGNDAHETESASKPHASIPIAICGMSLRLPGGSSSPQEFWDFLLAKGDARSRVPDSRYNVSAYHSKTKTPGAIATEYGYFLDESVKLGSLDTSRFTLSRAELEFADPQQRRLLEVVQEAFDDAGDTKFRGSSIGCYVGNMGEDWGEMMNRDPLSHGPNRIDGYNDWMLGNRISYEFDLKGPSMTIRTACSSALICLNEACTAIQQGVCDGAIVAGCTLIMTPGTTQSMTEKGILSPEGSCKSFSADADGYARGEAVTAIYIKPLDAAIRDGNPVRAVIRATMSSSDGKTQGITNPNGEVHEAMIRKTYEKAGIEDVTKTAYFECHGTGTPVGDPIEANAVARIFDSGIHITSVKPNVGHTEGASGLVSLIKAVMSLENRIIPPNIKFNVPNPSIPFKEGNLIVPVEPTPFPDDRLERVSVNSFGLGGSDAHVIIDSARSFSVSKKMKDADRIMEPQLLLFSAASAPSLKTMGTDYEDWITRRPDMADHLDDLAYTLANRREHLTHRSFKVVGTKSDQPTSAGRKIPSQPTSLVMVFTGQGAQWPRMGRELMLREDLRFRGTIRTLDKYLQEVPDAPYWTIEAELQKPARTSNIQKAELSQPLCTAVQIGLVDLFASIGVKPEAVVGHSSGELAAAYAAGALTAKEAIIGAHMRGKAATLQNKKGAMAAIGLGWSEVEKFLEAPNVVVACENSPSSVTLSGDAEAVKRTVASIKEEYPDITARLLKVEKAYHSYHMREIGGEYCTSILPHLEGREPVKPFFSSVSGTGKPAKSILGAKYWQQNLESPVLFSSAMSGVLKHVQNPVFLEIGPHGALAGPARQIFAKASVSPPYISAMIRSEDCVESYLASVGKLFELNVSIDFEALTPNGTCLPDLPRYPWNHETELWYESRMSREWRFPQFERHPLLGRRQLESTSLEPSFRNLINIDDVSWLRDHQIQGTIIFPAAAYMAMAGEAVRQLSDIEDSYSLRDVVLSQALVLEEGSEVEVVTNLRPHRQVDSSDTQWWEFTITSYNGQTWVMHCAGKVSASESEATKADTVVPLPRKLERKRVYDALAKAGMQYGPMFQGLDNITAGTLERKAASILNLGLDGDERHYHLHPTAIDAALQSGLVASQYGKISMGNMRAMPTLFKDVTIRRCPTQSEITVTAATTVHPGSGKIEGDFQCIANGNIVLSMPKAQFTPLEADESQNTHHLPITARVFWRPHVDFVDKSSLIKPIVPREKWTPLLDQMAKLLTVYTYRRIQSAKNVSDSLTVQNYTQWICRQYECLNGESGILSMDESTILEKMRHLRQDLSTSAVSGCAEGLGKIVENIDTLLSEEVDAFALLQSDNTLSSLFESSNAIDKSGLVQSIAHSRPNLRVLEIGASTMGFTAGMMRDLVLPTGEPLYSKYTYSESSSSSFSEYKKRFKDLRNIEYRVLDIAKDPKEQGFEKSQYDLIVATNVMHGTKSLNAALSNVRSLLAPQGKFVLQELNSQSKWVNCIFGFFDDWWSGVADNRVEEPYVTPSRWRTELQDAGFADLDTIVLDACEPHQLNSIMVASPKYDGTCQLGKPVVVLSDEDGEKVDLLTQELQARGYIVQTRKLGDKLPTSHDIISLLDFQGPFFENVSEARFKAFQHALAGVGEAGILWVTRPSQMHCNDPRFAQIIGAARSIRNEEIIDFATCEVDDFNASVRTVVDTFAHFQKRQEDELLRPDYEFAISNGIVHVPRIYPFQFKNEIQGNAEADSEPRAALVVDRPGRLSSLRWMSRQRRALRADQVEVQVHAACLSSKDVSVITGNAAYPDGGLGVEASGVISRIGSNVNGFAIGDRLMCLGAGSLASHVITSEALCEKIPDVLSFEEAATLPKAYVVAQAALFKIRNLEIGQSILVHNAAGNVGQAALWLAKMVKAEIFATVGSDDERQYLIEVFGLPESHVFKSTNMAFVDGVKRQTGGCGVDIALNSLSGDLLEATWTCVAEFGTMVQLGEKDLNISGQLDLQSFSGGRSCAAVDIDALMTKRQHVIKGLLRSTAQFLSDGRIRALSPRTTYAASSVDGAVVKLQESQQMGGIVLTIRGLHGGLTLGEISHKSISQEVKLDSSASYLLAGGLGGIASVIARHLVENGARRLVCFSRNPGGRSEDIDTIREFESMGCEVRLVKGNLIHKKDVENAIEQSPNLKGIIHCPMLLQDESFRNMTLDQWNAATDPKVKGAWYLHEATMKFSIDLDFFVLLSSMSGLNGQPGQANYAGANTFLDAFAQFRNNAGLAASSIDIGAVADMGYAARDSALLQRLIKNGYSGVTEPEMIEAATAAIMYPTTKTSCQADNGLFSHQNTFAVGFGSTVSLSSPESRSWWKKDVRMAAWHNINDENADQDGGSNNSLKAFIAESKSDAEILAKPETVTYIALEIGKQLMNLLLKSDEELDITLPLSQLGLDSLVGIELRNWWRQTFGLDISVLQLLGLGTLEALGKRAVDGMLKAIESS